MWTWRVNVRCPEEPTDNAVLCQYTSIQQLWLTYSSYYVQVMSSKNKILSDRWAHFDFANEQLWCMNAWNFCGQPFALIPM